VAAAQTARQPALRGAPSSALAGTSPEADFDFRSFLQGAGLQGVDVSPELARDFGEILCVVIGGLMDILRARERVKDEFRLRVTTFKATDNNPLKFSANVEDALHNLLVKRNPAYLDPVAAFEDAFRDLRNHQMAILAGIRAAYEGMLARFDPEKLQAEFDRQKKGKFLGAPAKLKYWDLYGERFRDRLRDADSCFRDLFGDEFAKAYEQQLARLRMLDQPGDE
jgi:type VI secretion system FHA domain protein